MPQHGLEQTRAQLPHIASEAQTGYTGAIIRHGKAVAVGVPVAQWPAEHTHKARDLGILAAR